MKHLFMEKSIPVIAIVMSIAFFMAGQASSVTPDWKNFIIEANLEYNTSCGGVDRTAKTASLRDKLVSDGWSGWRYVDEEAWPEDLKEATYYNGWYDDVYGDVKRALIFSGHSFDNCEQLHFSNEYEDGCRVDLNEEARLGTLGGDETTLVIMITCCVGNLGMRSHNWGQSKVKQVLGQHDVASWGSDSAKDFYNCTNSTSNRTCWRDNMDCYDNSPSVYTRGNGQTNAYNNHYGMKMKTGDYMGLASEDLTYSYRSLVDNGSSECNCD